MSKSQEDGSTEPDRASSSRSPAMVRKSLMVYIAAIWLLTVVATGVVSMEKLVLHRPDAKSLVFCCPGHQFTDFTDLSRRVAHFGEPGMLSRTDFTVPYPYPVPSVYVFLFFVRLFPHPLAVYLLFIVLSFFLATCWLSFRVKQLSPGLLPQVAVWSTLLLAYPLVFLFDRGNIEVVTWVFVLLGIVAYKRNWMYVSAILWALAASMKIFPGLLFVLFMAKRRYRVFGFAIAATAAITVLALAGVGPSVRQAALDSSSSATFIRNNYILVRNNSEFDHSLFSAIKQASMLYAIKLGTNKGVAVRHAVRIYSIAIPIGAALLWWFRLRRMPLLNQFMAYLTMCILLPYVSYEYTLIYVYLIWGAFLLFLLADVATAKVAVPAVAIRIILISCAGLFAPLAYLNGGQGHIGFGGPVKTLILLVLLVTVSRFPMPSSLFAELPVPAGDPEIDR